MKRFSLFGWLSAIAILVAPVVARDASASHPDILRNYRFIPLQSSLHVTEGFAGVNWDLKIGGTFGLVTGYEEGVTCAAIGCPPPSHIPFARFVDVEAQTFNPFTMGPMRWPGWDLDDTLNLSNLVGSFQPATPNRMFFHGYDGQGAPIKLEAIIRGPIIHLRGANDPHCHGCADYFGYKLNAFAYLSPHPDVNLDGATDAADFVMWQKLHSQAGGAGADALSATDAGEYELWRTQFGDAAVFSGFDEADFGSNPIPEPATLGLLLPVVFWLAGRMRLNRASAA